MTGQMKLSEFDSRQLRRFGLEISVVLVLGCLVVGAVPWLRGVFEPQSLGWYIASLSPLSTIALAIWVGVRNDRRSDEYQRKLQLHSVYFAFFGTGLVTFTYGLLELTGMPRVSMRNVWLVMTVMWCLGWCAVLLRDRQGRSVSNG